MRPFASRVLQLRLLLRALIVIAVLFAFASTSLAQIPDDKTPKLHWKPPHAFEPVPGISAVPACHLNDLLAKAGRRADDLIDHLQNFDAHEQVRFERVDKSGDSLLYLKGRYDYQADFGDSASPLRLHETRAPIGRNNDAILESEIDRGLVALALVFHPSMQTDFDIHCDGFVRRRGRGAFVVSFAQMNGKTPHAIALISPIGRYPVRIRGRAWIAADSGEVIHLETYLMDPVPELGLRSNATAIDYAPVKFQTKRVELWLPQSAVVYANYGKTRTIIEHSFSNFQLFSVDTRQVVETPKP
ncbi:MAG: hypothetical protein WA823_16635 [Candidatus Acidiferrales bacterium]